MIVFCNGMPRSASTWSFNVCRQLLSTAFGSDNIYAGYTESYTELTERLDSLPLHMLIKCHGLDDLARAAVLGGKAKVVYTHRNPMDAVASAMRMFERSFEEALEAVRWSWELYRSYSEATWVCVVPYECAVRDPGTEVRRIATWLGLHLSADELDRVTHETSLHTMKGIADRVEDLPADQVVRAGSLLYDRQTLLHRKHIRDGGFGYGHTTLTAEQQRRVAEVCKWA